MSITGLLATIARDLANNPTDAVITTSLCTVAAARGRHASERLAAIPGGTAVTTGAKPR